MVIDPGVGECGPASLVSSSGLAVTSSIGVSSAASGVTFPSSVSAIHAASALSFRSPSMRTAFSVFFIRAVLLICILLSWCISLSAFPGAVPALVPFVFHWLVSPFICTPSKTLQDSKCISRKFFCSDRLCFSLPLVCTPSKTRTNSKRRRKKFFSLGAYKKEAILLRRI